MPWQTGWVDRWLPAWHGPILMTPENECFSWSKYINITSKTNFDGPCLSVINKLPDTLVAISDNDEDKTIAVMTLHPLGKGMKYLLHGLSWFQPPNKIMKVIGYHPNYGWKHVGNTPNKYIPLLQLLNQDYLVMVPCQSPWRSAVEMNQKTPISWRIMDSKWSQLSQAFLKGAAPSWTPTIEFQVAHRRCPSFSLPDVNAGIPTSQEQAKPMIRRWFWNSTG